MQTGQWDLFREQLEEEEQRIDPNFQPSQSRGDVQSDGDASDSGPDDYVALLVAEDAAKPSRPRREKKADQSQPGIVVAKPKRQVLRPVDGDSTCPIEGCTHGKNWRGVR